MPPSLALTSPSLLEVTSALTPTQIPVKCLTLFALLHSIPVGRRAARLRLFLLRSLSLACCCKSMVHTSFDLNSPSSATSRLLVSPSNSLAGFLSLIYRAPLPLGPRCCCHSCIFSLLRSSSSSLPPRSLAKTSQCALQKMMSPTSTKGAFSLHRNHITTKKITRPHVIVWLVVVITFWYLLAQIARIWPEFSYNPICGLSLPALTPAACNPSFSSPPLPPPPSPPAFADSTPTEPAVHHYKIENHLHSNRPTPTPLPGRRYDPVTGKPLTPAGGRDAAAYLVQNYGDVPLDPFTKRPFDSFVDDMAEPRVPSIHKDPSPSEPAEVLDTVHNDLRILPLGDSITLGLGSHDFTGYRKYLQERLVADYDKVTLVGSLRNGSMENNDHDGWWGTDIAVIGGLAAMAYAKRPNVVLLHAGTNDIKYYGDNQQFLDLAPARLGLLVDQVHLACPDAVVLVAKIIRSGAYWAPLDRVVAFNEGVEREMLKRIATGRHVVLVDAFSRVAESDMYDPKHPTDEGNVRLSNVLCTC